MMKGKKDRKGYAKGGMTTKSGPDRGNGSGGYTSYADKTKATPAKPL
ncbi:MAG TPA: hypothetical protein VKP88_01140 [Candidatus Paceibacterota bacterium]|nr:hypothetical protein [Candidatus Paceibacterota bacterium]